MNPFHVKSNLQSYAYPITKIVVCCMIIPFYIECSRYISAEGIMDFIVRLIGVCIVMAGVLCIYISFAEIILVYDNREYTKETDITARNYAMYSTNEITRMVEKMI